MSVWDTQDDPYASWDTDIGDDDASASADAGSTETVSHIETLRAVAARGGELGAQAADLIEAHERREKEAALTAELVEAELARQALVASVQTTDLDLALMTPAELDEFVQSDPSIIARAESVRAALLSKIEDDRAKSTANLEADYIGEMKRQGLSDTAIALKVQELRDGAPSVDRLVAQGGLMESREVAAFAQQREFEAVTRAFAQQRLSLPEAATEAQMYIDAAVAAARETL